MMRDIAGFFEDPPRIPNRNKTTDQNDPIQVRLLVDLEEFAKNLAFAQARLKSTIEISGYRTGRPENFDERIIALAAAIIYRRKTGDEPGLWKQERGQPQLTPFGRLAAKMFEAFSLNQGSLYRACDWAVKQTRKK